MSWFRFGSALVHLVVALLYMVQFVFSIGSAVVKLVFRGGSAWVQCWFSDGALCVAWGSVLVQFCVATYFMVQFVSEFGHSAYRHQLCGVVQQGFSGDLAWCVWFDLVECSFGSAGATAAAPQ